MLPETPHFVLGNTFFVDCLYNATKGIQSIALTTGVLVTNRLLLSFFFRMFANVPHKDYSLLQLMDGKWNEPNIVGNGLSCSRISEN